MTAITLNYAKKTIELTKAFEKAASRYGSNEYLQLQDARQAYPNYSIVIKKSAKKGGTKRLTYEFMEKYIKAHDDEQESIMHDYTMLRATTNEGKEVNATSASYQEIESWFYKKFPAFAEYQEKQKKILAA